MRRGNGMGGRAGREGPSKGKRAGEGEDCFVSSGERERERRRRRNGPYKWAVSSFLPSFLPSCVRSFANPHLIPYRPSLRSRIAAWGMLHFDPIRSRAILRIPAGSSRSSYRRKGRSRSLALFSIFYCPTATERGERRARC